MRRISTCVTRSRSRRGWSLIILFKSMSLHQCTFAIFLCLFTSDLWLFGLSINTTAPERKDVRFRSSMLLQPTALKNLGVRKNEMNSVTLKFFTSLAIMCCTMADVPCNSSVGIENGDLPNSSFRASSFKAGHQAFRGRLNNRIRKIKETITVWGAWCADDSNKNQYIQVDLQTVRNVTGLATQGYLYGSVTSYQIMYSINGKQWFQYKDNSTMKAKIFVGNVDRSVKDNIVRQKLHRQLEARYIRFNPLTWTQVICMRVDVYACELPKVELPTTLPTTQDIPTSATVADRRPTKSTNKVDETTTNMATKENEVEQPTMTDLLPIDDEQNSGRTTYCSFYVLAACSICIALNIIMDW